MFTCYVYKIVQNAITNDVLCPGFGVEKVVLLICLTSHFGWGGGRR